MMRSRGRREPQEQSFVAKVYEILQLIPCGKVATYGMVARMAGKPLAARFVGFALRNAPPGLPCYRVVNQKGSLAPRDVFGSEDFQRHLLEKEGVRFLSCGLIDMKHCLWEPGDLVDGSYSCQLKGSKILNRT